MKKIILSAIAVLGIAAIVVSATGAFFSDTETSTGNTFTAGAIDLKVDSDAHYAGLYCDDGIWVDDPLVDAVTTRPDLLEGPCSGSWELTDLGPTNTFFNLGDLKPGDSGENTISLHVDDNDAYACAIISNLEDDDNGLTEPEADVPDATPGPLGGGELSGEINFFAWSETDGDNVWEDGELPLFADPYYGPASDVLGGATYPLFTPSNGALPGDTTTYVGLAWCYGDMTVDVVDEELSCDGAAVTNLTQTDSMTADISFYVEQARNNPNFECPGDVSPDTTSSVTGDELVTTLQELLGNPNAWLFYNDTNDTIMTLNQFTATGGANDIVAGPGAVGAAVMTLDSGTQSPDYDGSGDLGNPRYNIATYKYNDVKLADIGSLKYRIYDDSPSAQTPFLHFNVDIANNNTWQGRLVQVPTGIVVDTWTTVDALAGMWTKTSGDWPVGVNTLAPFAGSTPRTWADIVADYPNAETRSTDSFFGVRVGHPGPVGETSFVDWIDFDGEITDFEL